MGADVLVSEFVSSEALIREKAASLSKMALDAREHPIGIQIFGHDENSMRAAAEIAAQENPDFIDINWGCPVNKIVKKGAGSAILQDIPKMIRITAAVVRAMESIGRRNNSTNGTVCNALSCKSRAESIGRRTNSTNSTVRNDNATPHIEHPEYNNKSICSSNIPVTVKTRLGWDASSKPIVEIAERLQDIGISGISIHGRTRAQLYSGAADWTLIGEVKNNPRMYIPVFGNGDIDTAEKALLMRQRYGVDGVLIGRGAIGNPWIFAQVKELMRKEHLFQETHSYEHTEAGSKIRQEAIQIPERTEVSPQRSGHSEVIPYPTTAERIEVLLQHLRSEIKVRAAEPLTFELTPEERYARAERISCNEIKIHYGGYFKGIQGFKPYKVRLMQTSALTEVENILAEFRQA
jgi:tRNA-dihydrouridine synthase